MLFTFRLNGDVDSLRTGDEAKKVSNQGEYFGRAMETRDGTSRRRRVFNFAESLGLHGSVAGRIRARFRE